jgi:hypothetical protein
MASVAASIRSRVARSRPGTFFRVSEFDGPRRAVESAFSRLAAEEDSLLRVRRGLYWKGVKSRFGPGRPRPEDVVREVAEGRGVGPAGWSASHALGLSTQVPAVPEFAVVGPPPTGIRGAKFHSRRNFARLGLRYDEIALLEVLRDWPGHVEADWSDLERVVIGLRDDGRIRPDRVRRAATEERAPALRDRVTALVGDPARPAPASAGSFA